MVDLQVFVGCQRVVAVHQQVLVVLLVSDWLMCNLDHVTRSHALAPRFSGHRLAVWCSSRGCCAIGHLLNIVHSLADLAAVFADGACKR